MSDNPNSNIDDAPVPGGGASFLEILEKQLAAEKQEQCQAETDLSLPLSQKITNKNWKVRKSALDELVSKVNDLSSFDSDLFKILSQILTDPHQGNLEEAVKILKSYLEKNFAVPKENQNDLNIIIKLLIEKCFSSSKQSLKDEAKDMIISFVEYLTNTDILVDNLITIMQSKNQKMSQGAVSITTILLSLFGSSAFNYKKLSAAMTTLSDKCSPLIKQNIIEFFLELYKWIKKLLKPLIEKKVKGIIKNDIDKGIEQINEKLGIAYMPKATKFLGKKPKNADEGIEKNKNIVEDNGDIIMNDETEIDIFTKKLGFDEKFVERMLKPECKWKEKKQAFDQLTEITNPEKLKKKIKNTNRLNFMDMVKRLLKEPNQNVRHSIIRCMGNLAIGLGNNFTTEAKELFPRIIENLSFNKQAIINDIINTFINFSNIVDDNWINEAIIKYGTKTNLCNIAKTNLCTFIEKLLDSKKNNASNCYITTIKNIVIKYMDDHSQEIRNKATVLMSYIKTKYLNIYNNPTIKQALDEQKIKKIENFDKSLGNNKNNNTNENSTNNNNFKKKLTNISSTNSDLNSSIGTLEFGGNKKKTNKNGNNRSRNENKSKLLSCVSADNLIMTPLENIDLSDKDDVINLVKQFFGENNVNLFDSKKWQEKKEGFTSLNNYFMNDDNSDNLNTNYDYYLKFILIKNKSFKENNIVVFRESLICINTLIEKLPPIFSKKYYNPLLKLFMERLSERKIHTELTNIVENLIEKTSAKEIVLTLMKYIRNKTVPILNGGATIINNLINPNNIDINNNKIKDNLHLYPIKEIIEFCCFLENNTNTQCRNSGTNILCSLYAYMGNNIKILLKDLKESTLKVIEEKFEKITVINTSSNSSNNKVNNNILEQVFPRIDISKKITPNLIKDLTEGKWTNKKEAIISIENIIKSTNNTIQPKGLNELFNCIKLNLKDSNKNIVKMVMKLIEELCSALGSNGFRQYQKQIIPGIISNFSDKNTQVKDEAIKCIEHLIKTMGFDSIGSYFPNHLNLDNYETRHEILNILIRNKAFVSNKREYIKEYANPLINCLLDRNGIIRSMSEEIVQEIVKYFGISVFNDAIKNLKTPTVVNQIKLILNRINKLINGNNENLININTGSNNIKKPQKNNNRNTNDIIDEDSDNLNNSYYEVNNFGLNNINPNNMGNINYDNRYNNYNSNNNIFNQNQYNNNFNSYNNNQNIFNNNNMPMNQPFFINSIFTNNNDINPQSYYQNNNNSSSNEIGFLLKQIYSSDINGKYQALIQLQLLLQNNENLLNQKIIQEIFVAFNTLLSTITKNIKSQKDDNLEIQNIIENNQDIKLLKYLLDVYYYLSNQYQLMSILSNELIIYECYERLFIIITEKSLISFQCGTNLIQTLNSIIMNFFNNCNVTLSIISLIKIVLNYKSNTDDYAEVCTLAIKGLDKFRTFIFKLVNILDMTKIFESFYHFFSEFEKTNENLIPHNINEQNALAMINSMICEFIKIYGDKIWDIYQNSLSNDIKRVDIHLRRSIQINLRDYKNNNFLMNNNLDNNFNITNNNNNFTTVNNNLSSINNNNNIENNLERENNSPFINNTNNNNNNITDDDKKEEGDLMTLVNKLKENGNIMNTNEKNNYYKEIVSLLKKNNQSVTLISTKLDLEYYTKIYELYHSFDQQNTLKNENDIEKNNDFKTTKNINNNNNKNNTIRIVVNNQKTSLSNDRDNKLNQNNKNKDYILTEQAKRIQDYKNKYITLTEATNKDNNNNDIFSNNNIINNFNFKGKINDENKQINNNYGISDNSISELEARKREIDEMSKINKNYSKSIFNSQSDIPQINTSFLTNNNYGNQNKNVNVNISINNDKGILSQKSNYDNESIRNMRKNLDHIKLRVIKGMKKQNDN